MSPLVKGEGTNLNPLTKGEGTNLNPLTKGEAINLPFHCNRWVGSGV